MEKSIAPRVTIAWANRSAGQRTFGLAEEKEMKKKKKSSSRRKEGERRGEEEQASAVMGSKVESAPSSISSTLLGDYEYSVPSSTVQYYQYEYNTYPTIIRSKCLGSVLGPCLEEPISTRPFSIPGRDGLAQQWRSAEARRLSVLEARVLQAGQLGRYQELLVPPRMNGRLWQAWDSLPTFWIWRASHASLDGLDSSTNGSHDISWLA
ncbi:hypothetical protein N5P37_005451 [Trichoderma harzianum]|nr:hypothetical protein N5P37_005451 [Trichoderma harzianum]